MRSLSLSIKFAIIFIIIALLSVGIVALIANQVTTSQFGQYLQSNPLIEARMKRMMGPAMRDMDMSRMMKQMMGPSEQRFLQSVNQSLWIAALITMVLAVLLGFIFARRLTAPLKKLTAAASKIAEGDLPQSVPVDTQDEIGQLAVTFNSMAESLATNNQLRRQLLSNISHELQTPLSVIQGNLEAMLDGVWKPKPDRIATLYNETFLLSRLINDLKDLSLAEIGQLELQRSSADLASLINQTVEVFQPQAREKGITINVNLPSSFPLLNIDGNRISQVLYNLMSNAIRYTPSGGRIEIKGETKPSFIIISMANTGAGILKEELPRIFDPFYRVDPSRSRKSGGSGIGLAIVKYLVEAHGGKVWARSKTGKGSTFYFSLPL